MPIRATEQDGIGSVNNEIVEGVFSLERDHDGHATHHHDHSFDMELRRSESSRFEMKKSRKNTIL